MGKSQKDAEDLVENVDKERMAYIKHYFNATGRCAASIT